MAGRARAFFTILALIRSSCVLVALGGFSVTAPLNAQTCGHLGCIEETYTLNFLDNAESDAALGFVNRQSIDVAGTFLPNPFTPPGPSELAFAAQTTVTATQNMQSFALQYINSPALPDYWRALVPVATRLTGQWTLLATNPSYGTLQVPTAPIPTGTPVLPFINSVHISNLTPTATVSWIQPTVAPPPGATFGATIGARNISTGTVIDLDNIDDIKPGTLYSYDLTNFKTTTLVVGENYAIEVDSSLFDKSGVILSTSRSFFNFSPQAGAAGFSGPIQLPATAASIAGGPVYAFDFSVAAGVAYNIDPAIARGFIYEAGAGDPDFASVELPDIGNPNPYELYIWNGTSFVFEASLGADTIFNFGPGGVREFEVLGISPDLRLDPLNSNDFVTQVTFAGAGSFTGTMTPITASVPEPSTWAMMLAGFAGLGFAAYRRARSLSDAPGV